MVIYYSTILEWFTGFCILKIQHEMTHSAIIQLNPVYKWIGYKQCIIYKCEY